MAAKPYEKNHVKWCNAVKPWLQASFGQYTVSTFNEAVQEQLIRTLRAQLKPNAIKCYMCGIRRAIRWAATPDINNERQSNSDQRIITSLSRVLDILQAPDPKARTWSPSREQLAELIVETVREGDEEGRRLLLLLLASAGRPGQVHECSGKNLERHVLNIAPPDRRNFPNKYRAKIPLPWAVVADVRSWHTEWFCDSSDAIGRRMKRRADKLGMSEWCLSSIRDYTVNVMRHAPAQLALPAPTEQEIEIWFGHQRPDKKVHRRYGVFQDSYLFFCRVALEAEIRQIDALTEGKLVRQPPAKKAEWLSLKVLYHNTFPAKLLFVR